jgi:hypothetical protein
MMKSLLPVILLFLCSFARAIDQLPDAPVTPVDNNFWRLTGVLTATNIMDGYTTARDTHWGYIEVGSPWMYGRHPNALRYYTASFAFQGAEELVAYKVMKSRHKPLRLAGAALLMWGIEEHASGFGYNMTLHGPQKR